MRNPLFNYPRPKGLEEFVLMNADWNYLIYDKNGGYCTGEGCSCQYFEEGAYSHGEMMICYRCSRMTIALRKGRGRKNRTEFGRILWFRKHGRITFAQLDEYIINYENIKPEVTFWPSAQYKLSREECLYFKHIPDAYWHDESWEPRKTCKVPAPWSYCNWYSSKWNKTLIYDVELGTDLKYAEPDRYGTAINLMEYFRLFLKWQSIELMDKAGFRRIVDDRVTGNTSSCINFRGKDLQSVFRATKAELKEIRDSKASVADIEKWRRAQEQGLDIGINQLGILGYLWGDKVEGLKEYGVDLNKVIRYLFNDGKIRGTLGDYKDYIDDCIALRLNITDKRVARPKHFQEEHDRISKMVKLKFDEEKEQLFQEAEAEITKMDEAYEIGEYLIRPAASPQELVEESEKLHHCVRTYVDRVVKKSSAILFIRAKEKPEEPLYTLELSPAHNIVQVRGLRNIAPPPEVMQAVDTWKGELYGI